MSAAGESKLLLDVEELLKQQKAMKEQLHQIDENITKTQKLVREGLKTLGVILE
jgi:hypothetical protein